MEPEHPPADPGQQYTMAPEGQMAAEGLSLDKRFGHADSPQSNEAHQQQAEAHQVVPESDDADYSEQPSTDDFGSDGAHLHDPHQQEQHAEHTAHTDGAANGGSAVSGQSTATSAGANGTISTAAPVQLPCLIGKFTMDGATPVCQGQWGMSKADHGRPDMTSPFEFRLTQAADPSNTQFPVSGKYSGWFMVKQPPPKQPLKVEEKDLEFTFTPDAEGNFEVRGTGVNRFGKFSMNGKLTADGDLEVYRAYEVKKPAQPKSSKRVKRQELPVSPAPPARRQSRGSWKDKAGTFDDFGSFEGPSEPKPKRQSTHHHHAGGGGAGASGEVATTPAERPKRLSEHLKRCGEILRTLWKHPNAVWFREPVDPVKLGILDYFDIIKEPMDFGTIQKKLDNFEYDTPERFAEHVRLVFRNAITYNQLRTNPVHVAARELSDQFEEKYRIMISQLGSAGMASSQPKTTNKRQRTKSRSRSNASAAGPRSYEPISGFVDPNAAYIAEMQRQMQEMRRTIQQLESKVNHQQTPRGAPAGAAAAEPLTMEEKRQLITQINHLPPEKLTRVVQIVQDALPSRPQDDDDDEVEIPLDDLDTATLRKLQNYVESCMRATQKRKRPAVQRQSAAQLYTVAQDKRMRDDASVTSTQEQYTYAEHTQFASASEQQPPAAAAPSSGFFSGGAYAQDLGAGSGTDESDNEQLHGSSDFGAGNQSAPVRDDRSVKQQLEQPPSAPPRMQAAPAAPVAPASVSPPIQAAAPPMPPAAEAAAATDESDTHPVKRARSEEEENEVQAADLQLVDDNDDEDIALQNTSAWAIALESATTADDSGPSSSEAVAVASSWFEAKSELQERQERQSILKAQEERLEEERQRAELERIERLRAEAQRLEEERLRQQREKKERLEREREQERLKNMSLQRTVTIDQQPEAMDLLNQLQNGL